MGAFDRGAVEVMGSVGTPGARCWSAADRCTGMDSAEAGAGVAARAGVPGAPGAGEGPVAGADDGGVAAARAIGAPIGDLRDAVFAREAGVWAAAR
ncbi:hypothetical protein J3A78_007346 [Streptomyces sp. PvR006]|uniref:hypothetical protein n=1 Tax=Streptomyces sp. PvR006 TaxID=2817860 RepID=UPI001AE8CA78|nr:hypothetical protein [Streptomyces sp. PvR006]MBP2586868.1 hypothetical protein [Streptomyces sp. PvR006]